VLAALNLAYQLAERPGASAAQAGIAPSGNSVQIDTLLARIDAALAGDGQLL
jgi:hypothetical protein